MNNEEAKKIIAQSHLGLPYRVKEACEIAVEAICKRIPKQVELKGDGYDPDGNLVYDFGYCPNPDCAQTFEENDENWQCNYCPNCGQALIWFDNSEPEYEPDDWDSLANAERDH